MGLQPYLDLVLVTISTPDPPFESVEPSAGQGPPSSSSPYVEALRHLQRQDSVGDVTARLDALYSNGPSQIALELLEAQRQALVDGWC